MGEAKEPQARGGRRDKQYPPSRLRGLNTNGFRKGESGNPWGGSATALEIYRMSSGMTIDALPDLHRVAKAPETNDRDRILAITALDRIRMNSAQIAFGPGGMPSPLELSADGGVVTPLTRIAASGKNDYEILLAERNRINAELRRLDQERDAEKAARDRQLDDARAAKASGKELPAALALLLTVRDEDG
jgi:hypothetical protein